MPHFCGRCHLPFDTLVRDEARLSIHQVVQRCIECSHIIAYRSSGLVEPTEEEIAKYIAKQGAKS